jgi:DNA-binding IclR family transcriptional regulator
MNTTTLAPYILQALARYQLKDRRVTLQTLVDDLAIGRADLRRAVTALDQAGYVDAIRMRLTMEGFALGMALQERDLPPLCWTDDEAAAAA